VVKALISQSVHPLAIANIPLDPTSEPIQFAVPPRLCGSIFLSVRERRFAAAAVLHPVKNSAEEVE
jgi:hypothetical protein